MLLKAWEVWLYPHWQVLAPSPARAAAAGQCRCQGLQDQDHANTCNKNAANAEIRLYKASTYKKNEIESLHWKEVGVHDKKGKEAQLSGMPGL